MLMPPCATADSIRAPGVNARVNAAHGIVPIVRAHGVCVVCDPETAGAICWRVCPNEHAFVEHEFEPRDSAKKEGRSRRTMGFYHAEPPSGACKLDDTGNFVRRREV